MSPPTPQDKPRGPLASFDPTRLLDELDLQSPALQTVAEHVRRGDRSTALACLRQHFQRRFPPQPWPAEPTLIAEADALCRGVFRTTSRGELQFPELINWSRTPSGSVADAIDLARFYWARTLAHAWQATADPRYVERFIALAESFFADWPLSVSNPDWPDTVSPIRWSWVDLQIARRVRHLVEALQAMVHAPAFTPEFLARMLGWVIDHQVAALHRQKPQIDHNMAVSQQDGLSEVAHAFSEFRRSREWLAFALERLEVSLLAQTTEDGLQTEWTPGYHINVAGGAVNILERADAAGLTVSAVVRRRIHAMWRGCLAMLGPDRMLADFGDTKHHDGAPPQRFLQAARVLNDPTLGYFLEPTTAAMPPVCSHLAGSAFCVLRSDWGPDATALMLHCPPRSGGWHDEPDNATFELFIRGRRVMCDTGYYTYGQDAALRAWHRQTRVHQTLTLDDHDAAIAGSLRHFAPHLLCVENQSYDDLLHRRTIWMVNRRMFVVLDQAIGAATATASDISVHYQFAPGPVVVEPQRLRAWSAPGDGGTGLLLQALGSLSLHEEEGWHADGFASRRQRTAIRLRRQGDAAVFAVALVPLERADLPEIRLAGLDQVGPDELIPPLVLQVGSQQWPLPRA